MNKTPNPDPYKYSNLGIGIGYLSINYPIESALCSWWLSLSEAANGFNPMFVRIGPQALYALAGRAMVYLHDPNSVRDPEAILEDYLGMLRPRRNLDLNIGLITFSTRIDLENETVVSRISLRGLREPDQDQTVRTAHITDSFEAYERRFLASIKAEPRVHADE